MNNFKHFTITLFIIFSSLTGITYAETLKFSSSTYEGEVKKGKAYGLGIITFSDALNMRVKFLKIEFTVRENIQMETIMSLRENLEEENLEIKLTKRLEK